MEDIADTDRFLTAAQGRCWLAGFGWYLISASGEPLVRSIVDVSTGQPERLFFEGAPELGPGSPKTPWHGVRVLLRARRSTPRPSRLLRGG